MDFSGAFLSGFCACSIAATSNSLPSQILFLGYAGQVSTILASTEQVIICRQRVVFFSQTLASIASTNLRA